MPDYDKTLSDARLLLKSTWVTESRDGFDRIVILEYQPDCALIDIDEFKQLSSQNILNQIVDKLSQDLSLQAGIHYKITTNDLTASLDQDPYNNSNERIRLHATMKLREEEHFTMLKMHYQGI